MTSIILRTNSMRITVDFFWFFDVFRVQRKDALGTNGLIDWKSNPSKALH